MAANRPTNVYSTRQGNTTAPNDDAQAKQADRLARGLEDELARGLEEASRQEGHETLTVSSRAAHFMSEHAVSLLLGEALLFVLLGVVIWRSAVRRSRELLSNVPLPEVSRVQQSVDSLALEVERISEHQRYVTKLLNERLPAKLP